MRITRLVAGAVTAGLLGITPLAISAPAQATAVYQAVPSLEISLPYQYQESGRIPVGETVDVSISVKYAHPQYGESSVFDGTASLQMFTAKSGVWTDLGPAANNGYTSYNDIKPDSNTAFRVVYSGYTATSDSEDTFLPAQSADVPLPVTHKFKTNVGKNKSKKGTVIKGKVKPKYKKSKITILWKKKENAKYKKLRTIRTNKKSKFRTKLPAPRKVGPKYYFVFVTKGDKYFSPSSLGIYTSKGFFRTATR